MSGCSKADVNQSVVILAGRRGRIEHDMLVCGREEENDAATAAILICANMAMYVNSNDQDTGVSICDATTNAQWPLHANQWMEWVTAAPIVHCVALFV